MRNVEFNVCNVYTIKAHALFVHRIDIMLLFAYVKMDILRIYLENVRHASTNARLANWQIITVQNVLVKG